MPEGRRWQDWDIYPAAEQLDRFFPPVRVLLILDNLAGHKSYRLVQWCAEHGILLLWTPTSGSWLNMAESVQRIIKGRAPKGQHPANVQMLKQWLTDAVAASDPVHLGWQAARTSRSGLRAQTPPGRIRRDHDLRRSSTDPLGSLLQESRVMPQDLASDPLVTVLQYVENLSDRQAANAVRECIDWKYALDLELTDAGFDFVRHVTWQSIADAIGT